MIQKQFNDYIVNIIDARSLFDINDIHKYSMIYTDMSVYQYSSVVLIEIYDNHNLINNSIITANLGSTTVHSTSVIIENDRILLCCSDYVFCLEIPSLTLLWKVKADDITCFQIYKHEDVYIVHGEMLISCINNYGNILWQQNGADIFVTIDGNNHDFYLTEHYIVATDWDNKIYKIDYSGNILK